MILRLLQKLGSQPPWLGNKPKKIKKFNEILIKIHEICKHFGSDFLKCFGELKSGLKKWREKYEMIIKKLQGNYWRNMATNLNFIVIFHRKFETRNIPSSQPISNNVYSA